MGGKCWPKLANCGQLWPSMAKCGHVWPNVAKIGQDLANIWQDLVESVPILGQKPLQTRVRRPRTPVFGSVWLVPSMFCQFPGCTGFHSIATGNSECPPDPRPIPAEVCGLRTPGLSDSATEPQRGLPRPPPPDVTVPKSCPPCSLWATSPSIAVRSQWLSSLKAWPV